MSSEQAPPFGGILSLVLPSESQTLLLRSALLPADRAREAFRAWNSATPRPVLSIARPWGGGKSLAPLITANLRGEAELIDPELLTYLRTAAVREELRARPYRGITAEVFAAFAGSGIDWIALKGAPLSETVYPAPNLRHSHDVDILVREADLVRAADLVESAGFRPSTAGVDPSRSHFEWVHGSGLPLVLHTALFRFRRYNAPLAEVWSRAIRREILGSRVAVLSPPDQLLHVCAHATTGYHRESLLWACDAWFLLAAHPDLDWKALLVRASEARVSLPLYVTLDYLAGRLDAPVPADAIAELRAGAGRPERIDAELALFAAWARPGRRPSDLVRHAANWRERALALRWLLAPSPGAVVSAGRVASAAGWPAFAWDRALRLGRRSVRRLGGGDRGRTPADFPRATGEVGRRPLTTGGARHPAASPGSASRTAARPPGLR